MYVFALTLGVRRTTAQMAALFVSACPIVGFIGSRLLIDMSFTLSIIASIYLLIRAGIEGARKNLIWGVVCFCICLNTKIQAIAYLPLFFYIFVASSRNAIHKGDLTLSSFRNIAILGTILIASIGLSHYIRLFFGLGYQECLHMTNLEMGFNPFVQRILTRSKLKFLIYLTLLHPIAIILMCPRFWIQARRSLWTMPKPLFYLTISILYSTVITLLFSTAQERYWAHVFPLCFLFIAALVEQADDVPKRLSIMNGVYYAYFVLLFTNNFFINVILAGSRTAIVFPSLLNLFPFLCMDGGPFYNF